MARALLSVSFVRDAPDNQCAVPVTATGHCPVPVLPRRAKTSFPGRGAAPLRFAAPSAWVPKGRWPGHRCRLVRYDVGVALVLAVPGRSGFRTSSPAVDAAAGESGKRSRNGFQRSMASPRAQLARVSAAQATSPCGSIIRIGRRTFGWNAWDEIKLVFGLRTRSSLPRRGPCYASGKPSSRCHRHDTVA